MRSVLNNRKAISCLLALAAFSLLILLNSYSGSKICINQSLTECPTSEGLRLLVVSSVLHEADVLSEAAKEGVLVVQYDAEKSTLDSLLDQVRAVLDGRTAESIAIAAHDFGEAKFYLTGSETVSLGTVLGKETQRTFWMELGSMVAKGGHIDLLACNLARNDEGQMLVASIEELAGVTVAASVNNTGNPLVGGDWVLETAGIDVASLYFAPDRLSEFSGLLYSEFKKLLAWDGNTDDYFGFSVSISGVYAIVGAYGNDIKGLSSGSAYIFYRDSGGQYNWGYKKRLYAPDGAASDYFGRCVSIWGDYAIVGAYGQDVGGSSAGSAYIFYRHKGGTDAWGLQKEIFASDRATLDYFGYSVSIYGSYAAVGAYAEDTNGSSSGSVYIFSKNQGGTDNWGQLKKITAPDGAAYDYFGFSVSIYSYYVLVGAYGDDYNGSTSGSAYIFYQNQGGANNWGQQKKLLPSDGAAYDYFGRAGALYSSYALVGAWGDDDNGSSSGSAYVFYRYQGGTNNWGQQAKLKANDGASEDHFGRAVSLYGYYAAIGAYGDDPGGSAYVFYKNQGGTNNWGQKDKLTASDRATDDYTTLITGVSIYGGYVLIGAYGDDDKGSNSGSAYLYTFWPNISNPLVTNVTQNSATLGATVVNGGLGSVTERGVVWGTAANPTTTTNDGSGTAAGTTGPFTVNATGLSTNTTYHFRGYAKNTYGTSYTEDTTFTTGMASIPSITNPTATNIKSTTAQLGATVTADGGSAIVQRGVVWSTTSNPTTSSNEGMATAAGALGSFSVNATVLTGGVTYHYRGYALNAVGAAYTADKTFTTVLKKGRVKVQIKPKAAKQGDAMWRLVSVAPAPPDSERLKPAIATAWTKSGKKLIVDAGIYTVEFLHAPGWVHPTTSVEAIPGKKVKIRVDFQPYMISGASDYDGDGDSDIAVYSRSSNNWMIKDQYTQSYGVANCWPVPGDYDGDGAVELAWWSPLSQYWKVNGGFTIDNFGQEGDIPIPADYNGDGYTDAALYRPLTGEWIINYTSGVMKQGKSKAAAPVINVFGGGYYVLPVPGDYNGNGSAEMAVFNTSTGEWHLHDGDQHINYGNVGDLPVQADYDGDGDTDIAVVNMKLGEWRVRGQYTEIIGTKVGYIPVPGDFNGDGKAEVVYYRPSNGGWYFFDGTLIEYGGKNDLPLVRGK